MSAPLSELPDAELSARVADPVHGRAALLCLHTRHGDGLLSFVAARFGSDADDICQETWTRVYRKLLAGPAEMSNFRGWLFTIARNFGTDPHRRKKPVQMSETFDLADPNPTHGERRIATDAVTERESAMRHCFDNLRNQKPEHGDVVAAFLAGESPEAAAARLGISRANFDQRKKRALDALRTCVESRLP